MSQNLKQSMIEGGLWAAGGRLVAIVGAFVLNLVLARSLTPDDYGVYFVATSTMIILATVGSVGMNRVAVRFVAARKALGEWDEVRAVVWRCLATVLLATMLLCVAFHFAAPWFFNRVLEMPGAVAFGGLMVLWLLFSTIQRQLAETFRGLNDIRGATLFGGLRNNGILNSLVMSCAVLVLWMSGAMTLAAAFVTTVCASLLVVVVASWTLWRRLQATRGHARPVAASASSEGWSTKRALVEGWPLWLASLLAVSRAQGNGWFAAGFDSAENVALFAIAERSALLVTAPLTIVVLLLPPVVAELHARGEIERVGRVVQAVGGLASLPCIVILALIVLAGRPVLGMLFGEHYEAAHTMLVILCFGQVVNMATGAWQVVLAMTGFRHQVLRVSMCAAAVQFSCSIVGGYYAGVLGVAIGASAGAVAGNVLGLVVVRKHLGIWTFISMRRAVVMEAVALLARRVAGLMPVRARDA